MHPLLIKLNSELEKSHLVNNTHTCRELLEPIVFQYLRESYLHVLRNWWKTHQIPSESKKSIVIYETRNHEQLEFLILNLCYFSPDWALTIFCSEENVNYIRDIIGKRMVTIHIMRPTEGTYDSERNYYNTVLTSTSFWESLSMFEHVLLAEVDSYLLQPIRTIQNLEEYDYIASKWLWNPSAPGGGGLSIRRVSYMLKLCAIQKDINVMQDVWVSNEIQKLGGSVGCQFSESALLENPVGTHQWWSFYFQYSILISEQPEYLEYIEKLFILHGL